MYSFLSRTVPVDFTDAHGDSAADATEGCFAFSGNEGAGVEGEDAVRLRHLAELIFGGGHGEEWMDNGVDYVSEQAGSFEAGVAGDYQDWLSGGGDHG